MSDSREQMTQQTFDKLTAELQELTTTMRTEITERIEVARAHGDLKENAEYHAAKDEQGMNEDRIRTIQARIDNAEIISLDGMTDEVRVGMTLTITDEDETYDVFVGSMEDTPEDDIEVVSSASPMGKALLGSKPGAKVSWTGPSGQAFECTINEIHAH